MQNRDRVDWGKFVIHGREMSRVRELVEARERGEDDFVLLVTLSKTGMYDIDDGATRASVLMLSGAENVKAVMSPWV